MKFYTLIVFTVSLAVGISFSGKRNSWQSAWVQMDAKGKLTYQSDEQGNIIPDFSRVGFYSGDRAIPDIPVVTTISPSANPMQEIQKAIDELSALPLKNGFRGTILLKKGTYSIPGTIHIRASGIVLKGEGDEEGGTLLIATAKNKEPLIAVSGKGDIKELAGTRVKVEDALVPAGSFSFSVSNAAGFKKGDKVILYRPGTEAWVHDLKMDQIVGREGTKQWKGEEYNLRYEREVVKVEGNKITLDNPVVMPIETKYGGAELYKYSFTGRINHIGIEHLRFESEFESDTAENHSWDAVSFDRIENGWVRDVTAKYFAFSCVNLGGWARNITVINSNCFDHKSIITGGRRYSFSNNGQMNLFINCHASDGRHDFVTGARVCGPNVFFNCTARNTHADIGPHHRWSTGTLYDNIVTDGEINIQDRGNYGSGHGWVGTTQILWNCKAKQAAVQNPYISGKNYCIGLQGEKVSGRFKDRPDAIWEGQNKEGLQPKSLYEAQVRQRRSL